MTPDLFGHPAPLIARQTAAARKDRYTFRGNASAGRHGWLRLTPAYSLHVVRELLTAEGGNDRVLDPFSGTGTTAVVAASMGIPCDAVDINPFLVWLGNLKLQDFSPGIVASLLEEADGIVKHAVEHDQEGGDTWTPEIHEIEKWWGADVLRSLAALFAGIRNARPSAGDPVCDLLKIGFCRVMIENAQVTFGHQSMSFTKSAGRPQLSFARPDPAATRKRVFRGFLTSVASVVESLDTERPIAPGRVYLGDSRDLASVLHPGTYTRVITSPPYPNRMSYIRELRPYMYWLGFLDSGRQAGELDWRAIGGTWGIATSLLNEWKQSSDVTIPCVDFGRMIDGIRRNHPILAKYVHRYFEDIMQHVLSLREVLARGARCHYIVGNSKFYDTLVPVEDIFAGIFQIAGFADVHVETIRKRTSKRELYEFIVHATLG